MILTESGIPCINLRPSSTSNRLSASLSADAPLLASHNSLALETIVLQNSMLEIDAVKFPVSGANLSDLISQKAMFRRNLLANVTKYRVRKSLSRTGVRAHPWINRNTTITYYLHVEPESTTYPANGFRSNQLNNVALLSEWVDGQAEIIVKEHPAMYTRPSSIGYAVRNRNRTFYEALHKMPNVTLLSPRSASQYTINHSAIVATVGGSVGWEALSEGIPVIHFGNASYANAYGVHRWSGECNLAEILRTDGVVIAERAAHTRELLARNSYPHQEVDTRVGRARAVLAALESLLATTGQAPLSS